MLCAGHVFNRETQSLGGRLKTSVAWPPAPAERFARIKASHACLVELGQGVFLHVAEGN
jgi:hypothetical protein